MSGVGFTVTACLFSFAAINAFQSRTEAAFFPSIPSWFIGAIFAPILLGFVTYYRLRFSDWAIKRGEEMAKSEEAEAKPTKK